jgi:hypothetical protein
MALCIVGFSGFEIVHILKKFKDDSVSDSASVSILRCECEILDPLQTASLNHWTSFCTYISIICLLCFFSVMCYFA